MSCFPSVVCDSGHYETGKLHSSQALIATAHCLCFEIALPPPPTPPPMPRKCRGLCVGRGEGAGEVIHSLIALKQFPFSLLMCGRRKEIIKPEDKSESIKCVFVFVCVCVCGCVCVCAVVS